MTNLPAGFTPELWEGWENCKCGATDCKTIQRFLANGFRVAVLIERGGFIWMCMETWSGPLEPRTESECLTEVNAFAEKHGGWKS